ncbi:pyruvate kinase [Candidatus Synechococcus spongiarum]|uniref:Pyruvate kinase n=1 Tax=Candidatus Synechococcus spongiarum TaxID=431041 RepID=A0A165AF79_9SYNE|nr:pyruvate kinase [Candidatus Synechococcus spongiarum]SAY38617.1 Pyruvate kinase (EC 2.7.1.40) [Candidatus Synechococcus spongiarum]
MTAPQEGHANGQQGRDYVNRRTKIVATIGPATDSDQRIQQLIRAGATTFRLNFSHGSHAHHARRVATIRQVAHRMSQNIGILADLQGPKIRLGRFQDDRPIRLDRGDHFQLTSRPVACSKRIAQVTYNTLAEEVTAGARILLDDGRVEMQVAAVDLEAQTLHCQVVVGGMLSNNKGVNFPDVQLSVSAVTEKDRIDLRFALQQGVDWVALSFVRNPEDMVKVRELIRGHGYNTPVVAKIEKFEAISRIDEILPLCDGVMVARGDLGVEIPPEDVPLLQKELIRKANCLGIPIITATQMLDSMATNPRPTRAEVSDVANAILDGTDAVMLSNETAVGQYPVEAVETMATIARRIEQNYPQPRFTGDCQHTIPNSISQAVSTIACQLEAAAIVPLTQSGATARNVSKFRPTMPILAVTSQMQVARQLQLVWGVYPLLVDTQSSGSRTFTLALGIAREQGLLQEGDLVVQTAGTLAGVSGSTDLLRVGIVATVLGKGLGVGNASITARARVARSPQEARHLEPGEVLVVNQTSASYMDVIRRAGGILTELGGLQSHAAVIGQRLRIPVIVGVPGATQSVRQGEVITLDISHGLVKSGSNDLETHS